MPVSIRRAIPTGSIYPLVKARSSACLLTDILEVCGRQGWPASRIAILTAADFAFAREHDR